MLIYYSLMSIDNRLSLAVRVESDKKLTVIDGHAPENLHRQNA